MPVFSPESSSLSSIPAQPTAHEEMESDVGAKLASYQSTGTYDPTVIILESFFRFLPRDGARNISDDILGCNSDEELHSLATHLLSAVLVPMKAHGRTPIASPSPRFGAEDSVDEIASTLVESSSRNDQAWLKAACLRRDGNRCVISRCYDNNEAENLSPRELQQTATGDTEVAHIIPFSLGNFSEAERWNTATIWDAMYQCFPSIRSRVNLSADTINDTNNAMTMMNSFHTAFGMFQFALEPTGNENVYRLKKYRRFPSALNTFLPPSGLVTLTAHYPHHHLPSVSLLEAHAAIAQILHVSGMGEYVEKILRERHLIRCLAPDGTTNVASLLMIF